ncbi:hypothetical protein GL2_38530 [Microbulbifer sp. GL-2]|nr:hypothetical protein GL2_38530 [Microbulbifer sp. GL-2]
MGKNSRREDVRSCDKEIAGAKCFITDKASAIYSTDRFCDGGIAIIRPLQLLASLCVNVSYDMPDSHNTYS